MLMAPLMITKITMPLPLNPKENQRLHWIQERESCLESSLWSVEISLYSRSSQFNIYRLLHDINDNTHIIIKVCFFLFHQGVASSPDTDQHSTPDEFKAQMVSDEDSLNAWTIRT